MDCGTYSTWDLLIFLNRRVSCLMNQGSRKPYLLQSSQAQHLSQYQLTIEKHKYFTLIKTASLTLIPILVVNAALPLTISKMLHWTLWMISGEMIRSDVPPPS